MLHPTHRFNKRPQLTLRYLADYMAGSGRKKRSILQDNKYPPIARIIQHTAAQAIVSKFIRDKNDDVTWLAEEAVRLRERLSDDEFEQRVNMVNADYVERYAVVSNLIQWPAKATILPPGPAERILLGGTRISLGFQVRLRRVTKTNKIKEGAGVLRYAKGTKLPAETAAWQSAFIFGFLAGVVTDESISADKPLCLTIDAWAGVAHPAPSNSVSRYKDMEATCASIAEQWPNIPAPEGAIIE